MTETENKGRKFCFTRQEVRPNEVIEVLIITRQPEKTAWDHVAEVFSALKADNRMKITHWLDNIVLDDDQKKETNLRIPFYECELWHQYLQCNSFPLSLQDELLDT